MPTRTILLPLLLVTPHLPAPAAAEPVVAGRVGAVESAVVLVVGGWRVRVWGVDGPDPEQGCRDAGGAEYACGVAAREAMGALVLGKRAVCVEEAAPRAGAVVARCTVGEEDVGAALVAAGFAFDDPHDSRGLYVAAEERARAAGAGLWRGGFVKPALWRLFRALPPPPSGTGATGSARR